MSQTRKLRIYAALIESKLFYGLGTGCFTVAEMRRLDGFQARCLRIILKIPASFLSCVSNATVRQRAQSGVAPQQLVKRQLVLLGKVMRAPQDNPMQGVSFVPGTFHPATSRYVRRIGRPCKEWIPQAVAAGCRITGGMLQLEAAVSSNAVWKAFLRNAF